jgi:arylsulfatase A-like enzyme
MTDQHTFDALGCADHPVVETPNIDRIADSGVRFTDAYCPAPVCGPSRTSLFSGRYPSAHGSEGNWEPVDRDIDLLPELLSASGYHTARVGKLHIAPIAADHGFDYEQRHTTMNDLYNPNAPWMSDYVQWLADRRFDGDVEAVIERTNRDERQYPVYDAHRQFLLGSNWRTEGEHSNTWVTDRSVEYIEQHSDEPFFLFSSYFGPHQPMAAPGRWRDMYDPDDVPLPEEFYVDASDRPIGSRDGPSAFEESTYREVLAAYYGQISMIDHGIGRILDALEAEGLREDTVVAFTADHGEHAGQFGTFFKGTMYANAVRVPLIVADPQGTSARVCDRVVNNLDLFATLADRCDLSVDVGSVPSRSLQPLLSDPEADWLDRTYAELSSERMVVDGDYKLYQADSDEWHRTGDQTFVHELYNRTKRPLDGIDQWDDPKLADRQAELLELTERFRADTDNVFRES